MGFWPRLFILGFACLGMACTAANPEITSLATRSSVRIDGASGGLLVITNATAPLKISGRCPAATTSIELSDDDGATWRPLSEFAGQTLCREQLSFELTIENPRDFAGAGIGASFDKSMRLRSHFIDGETEIASYRIQYEDKTPLVPALTGLPASPTNEINHSVQVTGVHSYLHKVGDQLMDCANPQGYGSPVENGTPLPLLVTADGHHRLCVAGQDQWGRKDFIHAQRHDWTVDVTGPSFTFARAPGWRSPTANLGELVFIMTASEPLASPPLPQHIRNDGVDVTWSITPLGVTNQEYLLTALTASADGTIAPGIYSSTVTDALGNFNEAASDVSHALILDTTAPNPPVFTATALAPGNNRLPSLNFSSAEIGGSITLFTASDCAVASKVAEQRTDNLPARVTLSTALPSTPLVQTYTLYARQTDLAGNLSNCSTTFASYQLDLDPPRLTALTSPQSNGVYTVAGQTITITLETSENVTFPALASSLTLNSAPGQRAKATRPATSATNQNFDFIYTIAPGDYALDLDVSAVDLPTSSILDAAGNALVVDLATLGLTLANQKDLTVAVPRIGTVEALYPSQGLSWNKYIFFKPTASSMLEIPEAEVTACMGNENGFLDFPAGCFHAGERRRFEVPDQSSCTGLLIEEQLNNFDWTCQERGGKVVFISTGLKSGRGLKHLLRRDADGPAWIPNLVKVKKGTHVVAESQSAVWWNNPVLDLPLGAGQVVALNSQYTIYVVGSAIEVPGYHITGEGIAVVSLFQNNDPESEPYEMKYDNSATDSRCRWDSSQTPTIFGNTSKPRAVFCARNLRFLWLEVLVNGEGSTNSASHADAGLASEQLRFSRIVHSRWRNFRWGTTNPFPAVLLSKPRGNLIERFAVEGFGPVGLALDGVGASSDRALYNLVRSTSISMGRSTATLSTSTNIPLMRLSQGTQNRIQDVVLATQTSDGGNAYGLLVEQSKHSYIVGLRVSNIRRTLSDLSITEGSGVFIKESEDTSLAGLLSVANDESGLKVSSGKNNVFTHLTLVGNRDAGIKILSSDSTLFHSFLIANSQYGIIQTGGNAEFSNFAIDHINHRHIQFTSTNNKSIGYYSLGNTNADSCAASELTTGCSPNSANWAANRAFLVGGPALWGSLSGFDESKNSTDQSGHAPTDILDNSWTIFRNNFRAFFRHFAGGSLVDYGASGPCVNDTTAADCAIADFRLRGDSPYKNISMEGISTNPDPGLTFPTAAGPVSCSTAGPLSGDYNRAKPGSTSQKFHANAFEIPTPGSNGNGLCEPGETCVYSPNLGVYQGHEGLVPHLKTCKVDNDAFAAKPAIVIGMSVNGVTTQDP